MPEDQLELVFRMSFMREQDASEAARLRSRAVALVKDIVASRLSVEAEEHGGQFLRARGFTEVGAALAATRAVQLAFDSFRTATGASRTNVSVILDASQAFQPSQGPSFEQQDLFQQARSSQVLVTQALFDQVDRFRPLPFRSFAPRAGVYEFLWTSAERLETLQTDIGRLTELVDSPLPLADFADQPAHPPVDLGATVIYRAPTHAPAPPAPEPQPLSSPYEETEAEPVRSRSRFKIIAFSAVAAVLLAVAGLVLWRQGFANPLPQQPASVTAKSDSVPTPPPIPPDPATTPQAEEKITPPSKPPTVKPAANEPALHTAPTPKRTRTCSSEISIPTLLSLAEGHRNHRQFDEAESEYQQVLQCEPGNREAKLGLQKIRADEQLN